MKSSSSRKREKKTTTAKTKKKNPKDELKKEPEIVMISSSSASEEPNEEEEQEEEEEEEAKSSNNSNQNMNEESMEEGEEEEEEEQEETDIKKKGKKKNISNGSASVSCCFPTNRIKKIVRNEGFDFRISQEAIFIINKATEQFLEQFCEDAYTNVVKDRKKAVAYKHLSSVVSKTKRYDFLSDFVPEKITAEDALSERKIAGT